MEEQNIDTMKEHDPRHNFSNLERLLEIFLIII
jgi:hypothetical protein